MITSTTIHLINTCNNLHQVRDFGDDEYELPGMKMSTRDKINKQIQQQRDANLKNQRLVKTPSKPGGLVREDSMAKLPSLQRPFPRAGGTDRVVTWSQQVSGVQAWDQVMC